MKCWSSVGGHIAIVYRSAEERRGKVVMKMFDKEYKGEL